MGKLFNFLLLGVWYKPWEWPDDISNAFNSMMEGFSNWWNGWLDQFLEGLVGDTLRGCLDSTLDVGLMPVKNFSTLAKTLGNVLKADPNHPELLGEGFTNAFNIIKTVSEKCLLPLSGVLLAYILVKFIYDKVTDSGRSTGEVTSWDIAQILIRICCAILIVTHAWDIVLIFWQIATNFVNETTAAASGLIDEVDLTAQAKALYADREVWSWNALLGPFLLFEPVACILSIIAWLSLIKLIILILSRTLNFLVYCSFAPLAFATLIDKSWLGNVGQNYLKNLLAFALQAFFIMLILNLAQPIYDMLSGIASLTDDNPGLTMALIQLAGFRVLAMWIVTFTCQGSLGIAKSMVGAQ